MSDNYRKERIERLLRELQYEIEIGMMQGEIEESLGLRFYVPTSKSIPDGVVFCEFRTRPIHRHSIIGCELGTEPKLRIVKGND